MHKMKKYQIGVNRHFLLLRFKRISKDLDLGELITKEANVIVSGYIIKSVVLCKSQCLQYK